MDLNKLTIEEIDALSNQLLELKRKKLKNERIDFINRLVEFLETATNDWNLFEVYPEDAVLTVDDVIDRLHDDLNSL